MQTDILSEFVGAVVVKDECMCERKILCFCYDPSLNKNLKNENKNKNAKTTDVLIQPITFIIMGSEQCKGI